MLRGVRAAFRLVWDKAAGNRLKREAQDALKDGTDPRRAKRNVREVEGAFERLKGVAAKVAVALGAVWVVRKVAEYGKAVFDLGSQVLAVGNQFNVVFGDRLGAQLRARTEELRLMAGLTRRQSEELLAGAGSMAQGFGMGAEASADFAEQVLRLSGDLASFNNVPTAHAAQLIQSALIGNTEAARSLKINFTALDVQNRALAMTGKDTAAALTQEDKALAGLQVMMERAGPQMGDLNRTQHDSDNLAKQLAGSYQQVKDSLAAVLVEGSAGELGLGRIRDLFRDLDAWVVRNAESIQFWATGTIRVATGLLLGMYRAVLSLGNGIVGLGSAIVSGAVRPFVWLLDGLTAASAGIEKFWRVLGRDEAANAVARQTEQLRGYADALRHVADVAGDVAEEAFGDMMRPGVTRTDAVIATHVATTMPSGAGGGGSEAAAEATLRAYAGALEKLAPSIVGPAAERALSQSLSIVDSGMLEGLAQRNTAAWMDANADIVMSAQSAAIGVMDAWGGALSQIMADGKITGEAIRGVFAGMGAAALGSLAQMAAGKVVENVANAIESFALASKLTALGALPLAAAASNAGKGYLAAAAKWGAVGAVSAGAAAALSASGGMGGGRGGFDPMGRQADRSTRDPGRIEVYVDPFNPGNPVHVRKVGQAMDLDVRLSGRPEWAKAAP